MKKFYLFLFIFGLFFTAKPAHAGYNSQFCTHAPETSIAYCNETYTYTIGSNEAGDYDTIYIYQGEAVSGNTNPSIYVSSSSPDGWTYDSTVQKETNGGWGVHNVFKFTHSGAITSTTGQVIYLTVTNPNTSYMYNRTGIQGATNESWIACDPQAIYFSGSCNPTPTPTPVPPTPTLPHMAVGVQSATQGLILGAKTSALESLGNLIPMAAVVLISVAVLYFSFRFFFGFTGIGGGADDNYTDRGDSGPEFNGPLSDAADDAYHAGKINREEREAIQNDAGYGN